MDIRNDASNQYFFAHLVRRPKTEVASILKFNICYIALASLLAEKRIYIKDNMIIPNDTSDLIFFAYQAGRPLPDSRRGCRVTPAGAGQAEVPAMLVFTII
ncbi:hypothetical protein SAMN04489724_0631 [Algoriphagus locisalis]|uniref:Uncharacterized protein n=1 Tax=Algoriphagus locisalis TaxID=305507 RepID=A0A1I6XSC8_9BACT|nr:hypothetical protein [Algoriphagus locisalis]SFT40933.1 hypothetical protein SAMN04489724_0631 [Algoriphagus locisalis]